MDNFMQYDLSDEANLARYDKIHNDQKLHAQGAGNNGRIPPFDGNVYIVDVKDETDFAVSILLENVN